MSATFRVLVVDDEELYARAIGAELGRRGIATELCFSAREALARVEAASFQVILLDHRLPDEDGLRLIPQLLARQPGVSLVMMTAYHTIPNAVAAIRRGAEDYVVKETSIQPLVERVLELGRRLEARAAMAGPEGWQEHRKGGLLGRSPGVLRVLEQLQKASRSPETTVLLTGETGVGKEVAARHLHQLTRPKSPFIAVDCVALPTNLAESILFGHEKGAFTGADQARAGAFEEADDGTVLLDEIGDMADEQGKLLRVMESRAFTRVGSVREIPLKARVVAATNQDLGELVKQGRFRHDLFQRLCVFPIHIPPLRERGEDALLLAEHFLSFYAGKLGRALEPLSDELRERLRDYPYPGNVRELKNIIERAVIMADGGRLELRHLPARVLEASPEGGARPGAVPVDFRPGVDTLESLEKRMIEHALKQAGGVKAEAARILGISRFQLLRRLERHGLLPPREGADSGDGAEPGTEDGEG
ncbi:MAG TPA: sigma-54 dependent transcriptional regulator [Myxococcota bacterium]|nr:sigma-54 dependent transcriptional regulator [Myxococcota bacterium]HRY93086.1 sigma-54 dependent transcriptional regulator [Myxococcota bacterium]HSA20091.1 sigma-54 dependent transcriptional regulator [Myxococcota bacterium]